MAEVYANLIRRGRKTIEQAPERLREESQGHSRGGRQRMSRLREFALKILLRKEKGIMAVIYATLIVKGKKTLDQVPALIRKQVEEILKDLEVEVE